MDIHEVEAAARKLSPRERRLLATRLLASVDPADLELPADDPIYSLGKNPVSSRSLDEDIADDGSIPGRGGTTSGERPIEEDSIWGLGSNPVDCGVTDGSVNHDHYIYGTPKRVP